MPCAVSGEQRRLPGRGQCQEKEPLAWATTQANLDTTVPPPIMPRGAACGGGSRPEVSRAGAMQKQVPGPGPGPASRRWQTQGPGQLSTHSEGDGTGHSQGRGGTGESASTSGPKPFPLCEDPPPRPACLPVTQGCSLPCPHLAPSCHCCRPLLSSQPPGGPFLSLPPADPRGRVLVSRPLVLRTVPLL